MPISRRQLLRYGLGGSAILLLGGVGLALQPGRERRPAGGLQALDPRAFSILAAAVDRMIPPREGFPSPASLGTAERIDAFLATCHPSVQKEFRQALHAFENGLVGLVFEGRTRAFTSLPPDAQDRSLRAWRESPWTFRRTVYQAIHGLAMAVYYSSPETYAAVGYPGPPLLRPPGGPP